jgi:hypothetical protein
MVKATFYALLCFRLLRSAIIAAEFGQVHLNHNFSAESLDKRYNFINILPGSAFDTLVVLIPYMFELMARAFLDSFFSEGIL